MKRTESTSSAQVLEKTKPEEFDLVILGGGTGSTIAAWTFAGEGKRVAVVERKYIGGSCPNIACWIWSPSNRPSQNQTPRDNSIGWARVRLALRARPGSHHWIRYGGIDRIVRRNA